MQINEIAKRCGVSVRTLRYYDHIGLLCPEKMNDSGYRVYGEKEIARLRQILFFRELEFPLKQIKQILEAPSFDETEILSRQKHLLILKRERLNRLICLAEDVLKGGKELEMEAFDQTKINEEVEKFSKEAAERWGNTAAWKEYVEKTAGIEKEMIGRTSESDKLFKQFAAKKGLDPSAAEVQAIVKQWQDHITKNWYTCTDEILYQLGEMYVSDERFKAFYEENYGDGTAEFIRDAIFIYCKKDN